MEIQKFCEERDKGGVVAIPEDIFYYFLEVLPPVSMGKAVPRSA